MDRDMINIIIGVVAILIILAIVSLVVFLVKRFWGLFARQTNSSSSNEDGRYREGVQMRNFLIFPLTILVLASVYFYLDKFTAPIDLTGGKISVYQNYGFTLQ